MYHARPVVSRSLQARGSPLSQTRPDPYSAAMKTAIRTAIAAFALAALPGVAAETSSIPMNPLAPSSLYGHTNAFLLQNRQVEFAIFPTIGRVGLMNFRGEPNLLRFDEGLASRATEPATEPSGEWRNFGGDWVWPVSQNRWPDHFAGYWPPPWLLDGPAWTARGWVNRDQSQTVLLEIKLGAPVNIAVQRKFTLPADATTLTIQQRIERTADSSIPVTLWNISQLKGVQRIAMAVETNSAFVDGYHVLDFSPPREEILHRETPSVLVADVTNAGEIKIGTDSPRGWIAAQRDDFAVIERAIGSPTATDFPDGGCRTEVYSNSGLGYTEVETLSEERNLAVGEAIENTLTLSLHRIAAGLDATAFATRIRELLGEQAPATPAPVAH